MELIDTLRNRSGTTQKRDSLHKMAEANRAFAHYLEIHTKIKETNAEGGCSIWLECQIVVLEVTGSIPVVRPADFLFFLT